MCCVRFVNFEPACSPANQRFQLSIISNQRVRLSISNQCVLSSIGTFLKTSDQRIEQITITQLLIAPRIVLERQCCVVKTTDNSQLGQSGGRQYCLIAAFVSSKFDRRLFRSRVHSIETKGQFDPSKGFDRRVSDNKN